MTNKLEDMLLFERVAHHRSFTRAARELGRSKASVSARVGALEARLGVRLLQRTTRSVALTDAGRIYADRCRQVLVDAREADLAVASAAPVPHGVLRLSCPRLFGTAFLTPILARFLHEHPQVQAEVHLSERFVDLIEEGFDLGIRVGRLPPGSLVARKLGAASSVRVRAPGSAPGTVGIGPHQPQNRASVDSLEMARDLAIAGLGEVLLPRFVCSQAIEDGLLEVVGEPGPQFPIHVVYPERRLISARVRAFVDLLVERTRDEPWR